MPVHTVIPEFVPLAHGLVPDGHPNVPLLAGVLLAPLVLLAVVIGLASRAERRERPLDGDDC